MSTPNRYDGFIARVFIDEEGDHVAHFVELPNVSAFGKSRSDALNELSVAWDLVKHSYRAAGQEVPAAYQG